MANYKAQFVSAAGQKEVVLRDVTVSAPVVVGQLCKYDKATNALTASTSAAPVAGDVIIAQSDMTMAYGHVPVEYRDYGYSNMVNPGQKNVAVFFVTDVSDVYTVQM